MTNIAVGAQLGKLKELPESATVPAGAVPAAASAGTKGSRIERRTNISRKRAPAIMLTERAISGRLNFILLY